MSSSANWRPKALGSGLVKAEIGGATWPATGAGTVATDSVERPATHGAPSVHSTVGLAAIVV